MLNGVPPLRIEAGPPLVHVYPAGTPLFPLPTLSRFVFRDEAKGGLAKSSTPPPR